MVRETKPESTHSITICVSLGPARPSETERLHTTVPGLCLIGHLKRASTQVVQWILYRKDCHKTYRRNMDMASNADLLETL